MLVPFTPAIAQVLGLGIGIQLRADVDAGAGEWDLLNNSFTRMHLPDELTITDVP